MDIDLLEVSNNHIILMDIDLLEVRNNHIVAVFFFSAV